MALTDVPDRCPRAEMREESRIPLLTKERWTFAQRPLLTGHYSQLASAHSVPSLPSLAHRLTTERFRFCHPDQQDWETPGPSKTDLPGNRLPPREPRARVGRVPIATLG